MEFIEKDGGIIFKVRVLPKSSKSGIVGELDGALKVKLKSPPIDGAANAELIRLLSKTFNVSKSAIEIVGGETSKNKQLKIENLTAETFLKTLGKFQLFSAKDL